MSKVYSVVRGMINEYELIKETPCFYVINNTSGHKEKISKDGFSIPYRSGGKSTATKDILEAATAAQGQINIINGHIEKEQAHLINAEIALKEFSELHTISED